MYRASTWFSWVYASVVANVASFLGMALTAALVPWIIHRIPYFNRTDVLARRAAKARLPVWVSFAEFFLFVVSELAFIFLFFSTEAYFHQVLHPGSAFLSPQQPKLSFDLAFWLIQALAPLIAALPPGMVVANLISWSIRAIRSAENEIMNEGVPSYTWRDANVGLLKATAIMVPISIVIGSISLFRL
jgi:hypothetical protein